MPTESEQKKLNNKQPKPSKKKPQRLPNAANITWGSSAPPKKETNQPKYTRDQLIIFGTFGFLLFLFLLYVFVPDQPTIIHEKNKFKKPTINETEIYGTKKDFSFEKSKLFNSSELIEQLEKIKPNEDHDYDDRILLVVFDDSRGEQANGDATKLKTFRKFESIAKSLPRKPMFKRQEEDELPLIILFDCGNSNDEQAQSLCAQVIGDRKPSYVVFRSGHQPRALPDEYKSENQIIQYLYNLMQPAVKILKDSTEVEEFVADDKEMNVVYFGSNPNSVYEQISDLLREYGKFGFTKNPGHAELYDIPSLPNILVWRTFGNNPQIYNGNITDMNSISKFILDNYLPVFGEINTRIYNKYLKRGLPLFWFAYDPSQDNIKRVINVVEDYAYKYQGHLSFVQLDVKSNPEMAKQFGIDLNKINEETTDDDENKEDKPSNELPQILVMNQVAQLREVIDLDNVEQSVDKIIKDYSIKYNEVQNKNKQQQQQQQPFDPMDIDNTGSDDDDSQYLEDDDEEAQSNNNPDEKSPKGEL